MAINNRMIMMNSESTGCQRLAVVIAFSFISVTLLGYGTKKIFSEIAGSKAFSLAGGGHTIGALEEFGLIKKVSYVSTAGGALIEFLMGKKLPGVVTLEKVVLKKA